MYRLNVADYATISLSIETSPKVGHRCIEFVKAKYYKDSEMTAYISERSRNSK